MCTFHVDNPELIRTILISTHQVFLWQGFMIAFCGFNVIVHRYVICFIIISISEWLIRTDINWLKMSISHAYFCSAKEDILLQTLRDSRHWIKPYYNIFFVIFHITINSLYYEEYDRLLLIKNYRKHCNITSHEAGPVEASFCCFK